jgi:hypothetical protein
LSFTSQISVTKLYYIRQYCHPMLHRSERTTEIEPTI